MAEHQIAQRHQTQQTQVADDASSDEAQPGLQPDGVFRNASQSIVWVQ
jgi:hypothetical protein